MSCNSTSNRVAGAACAAGISRLASKYGFYAGVAAAGLGAALLVAKLSKSWRSDRTTRQELAAARQREEDEISRLLADPEPEGEHTRYHLFDKDGGEYLGWTHSRPAAEKMAAQRGWKVMSASSTQTEEKVERVYRASAGSEGEKIEWALDRRQADLMVDFLTDQAGYHEEGSAPAERLLDILESLESAMPTRSRGKVAWILDQDQAELVERLLTDQAEYHEDDSEPARRLLAVRDSLASARKSPSYEILGGSK